MNKTENRRDTGSEKVSSQALVGYYMPSLRTGVLQQSWRLRMTTQDYALQDNDTHILQERPWERASGSFL